MTRLKIKSRSHHDVAHLQPPPNIPMKYQLTTPYGFRVKSRLHNDFEHLHPLPNVPTKVSTSYTFPVNITNVYKCL